MTNLDNEISRIATFRDWELNSPSALILARAGLYYSGPGDTVCCYKCNTAISDWKKNDVPVERHWFSSPNCPLVASLPAYRSTPASTITQPSEVVYNRENPQHSSRSHQPGPAIPQPSEVAYNQQYLVYHPRPYPPGPAITQPSEVVHNQENQQHPSRPHQPGLDITQPSEVLYNRQNPVHPSTQYHRGESLSLHLTSAPPPLPNRTPSSIRTDDHTPQRGVHLGAHLKHEVNRFRTFDSWINPYVNGRDLAKAGFFFMGIGDCVKCAFCSNILKQWEPGDVPLEEHRKHFPKCPFVSGVDVGNRPEERPINGQHSRVMQDSSSAAARGGRGAGAEGGIHYPPPLDISPIDTRHSFNFDANFATMQQRLRSYENVPLPRGQKKEELAEAGFYYVGPGDSVKCFQCGGVLKKWAEDDEPWIEHAKWFRNCTFLSDKKSYKFIKEIQDQLSRPATMMAQQPESYDEDTMLKRGIGESEQEESTSLKQEFLPSSNSNSKSSAASSGIVSWQLQEVITDPPEKPSSSSFPLPSSSANHLQPVKDGGEEFSTMAKENERLKEAIQCKICMDAMANTVFLPCGHLLCCEQCAPAIIDCPVCRGLIKGTLKVYIS